MQLRVGEAIRRQTFFADSARARFALQTVALARRKTTEVVYIISVAHNAARTRVAANPCCLVVLSPLVFAEVSQCLHDVAQRARERVLFWIACSANKVFTAHR